MSSGPDGAQEAAAEAMRSNASLLRGLSLCCVFGLGGWVSSGPGWSTGSSSRGDEEQSFSLKVSLSLSAVFLAWLGGCHPGPDGAQEAAAEATRSNASLLRCLSVCVVCLAWVGGCRPGSDGAQEAAAEAMRSNASLLRCLSLCVWCVWLGWVGVIRARMEHRKQVFETKKCSLHVKTFRLADSTVAFVTVVDALEDIHFFLSDFM